MSGSYASSQDEAGYVLVTIITIMLPLVVIVGAGSSLMSGRNKQLLRDIRETRAQLAAEAGVEEAIYRARIGTLAVGGSFTRDLGAGVSIAVDNVHLGSDLLDNDGDSEIDEPDEDVLEVTVSGIFRNRVRRLAVHLAREARPDPEGAITYQSAQPTDVKSLGTVSGVDTNIDDSPGNPADDVFGLAIVPPGTTASLSASLTIGSGSSVTGNGGSPSLGVTSGPIDAEELAMPVQNDPDMTIADSVVDNLVAGTPAAPLRVYRDGNLEINDGSGAGTLVVTGTLKLDDTFRWDGLVVALGDFEVKDLALLNGAVVLGPASSDVLIHQGGKVRFSQEALDMASAATSAYAARRAWQEITRN